MYFSYLLDNDIFPNDTDRDIKLKAKAIGKFFKSIEFRSAWFDCSNMGMYNKVAERFLLYRDSKIIPARTKARFMEVWRKFLYDKAVDLKRTDCQCSYPDCQINDNYYTINNKYKCMPHFVISEKKEDQFSILNPKNCKGNDSYKKMSSNSTWKDPIPYDDNLAKEIFHKGFTAAFLGKVKQLTIYDRNIWQYWGEDIEKGLLSFITLINSCGINQITIFTGYRKRHSLDDNTNDHDIRRYISDFLKNKLPAEVKIEFIVSNSMQHYRFIKIHDLLCIDLDNGVSTFNPPKSVSETKRFKVDYKLVDEYFDELIEANNNRLDEYSISLS